MRTTHKRQKIQKKKKKETRAYDLTVNCLCFPFFFYLLCFHEKKKCRCIQNRLVGRLYIYFDLFMKCCKFRELIVIAHMHSYQSKG